MVVQEMRARRFATPLPAASDVMLMLCCVPSFRFVSFVLVNISHWIHNATQHTFSLRSHFSSSQHMFKQER